MGGPRRYIVKAVTSSPGWTGTLWGIGYDKLAPAQRRFEERVQELEKGDLTAMLLIDRIQRKVLRSAGTSDPAATARAFGEEIVP